MGRQNPFSRTLGGGGGAFSPIGNIAWNQVLRDPRRAPASSMGAYTLPHQRGVSRYGYVQGGWPSHTIPPDRPGGYPGYSPYAHYRPVMSGYLTDIGIPEKWQNALMLGVGIAAGAIIINFLPRGIGGKGKPILSGLGKLKRKPRSKKRCCVRWKKTKAGYRCAKYAGTKTRRRKPRKTKKRRGRRR